MNKLKSFYLFTFFLITFYYSGYSQYPNWINYTHVQAVYTLAEEANYIWVGAYGGGLIKVNKTSGAIDFYNKVNSGLPGNTVYTVAVDGAGNKWIGSSGLAVFKKDGITASDDIIKLLSNRGYTLRLHQTCRTIRISYSILKQNHVDLHVFDIKGRILKTLVNNVKKAGNHQVNFDCRDLSNGTYFVHLQVGERAVTKKIVVLR